MIGWDAGAGAFHGDERIMLAEFWRRMKSFRPNVDRIVGHNIYDFDLKFILKRSVAYGVRPTVGLSFARYPNQPIFDTMHEWEPWGHGPKAGVDTLARALGFESSKRNGVNGSKIHSLFEAGEHRAIHDYYLKDVELTRVIYKRMVFEECAPTTGPRPIVAPNGLAAAR